MYYLVCGNCKYRIPFNTAELSEIYDQYIMTLNERRKLKYGDKTIRVQCCQDENFWWIWKDDREEE